MTSFDAASFDTSFDPASLEAFRLLFDFGLVVLIWLVQLVIYPSFGHVAADRLVDWHGRYTVKISLVVVPLMLGQAAVVALQVLSRGAALDWASATLVVAVWLTTFLVAVPTHEKIAEGGDPGVHVPALVRGNWPRTWLWTAIFAIGWYEAAIVS